MLDLVDEALDQMALFVQVLVILTLLFSIGARRNHGLHPPGFDSFDQLGIIVAFVGQQHLCRVAFNQRLGLRAIVTLTRRQDEAQRIAKRINCYMNLGRKATAAAP